MWHFYSKVTLDSWFSVLRHCQCINMSEKSYLFPSLLVWIFMRGYCCSCRFIWREPRRCIGNDLASRRPGCFWIPAKHGRLFVILRPQRLHCPVCLQHNGTPGQWDLYKFYFKSDRSTVIQMHCCVSAATWGPCCLLTSGYWVRWETILLFGIWTVH